MPPLCELYAQCKTLLAQNKAFKIITATSVLHQQGRACQAALHTSHTAPLPLAHSRMRAHSAPRGSWSSWHDEMRSPPSMTTGPAVAGVPTTWRSGSSGTCPTQPPRPSNRTAPPLHRPCHSSAHQGSPSIRLGRHCRLCHTPAHTMPSYLRLWAGTTGQAACKAERWTRHKDQGDVMGQASGGDESQRGHRTRVCQAACNWRPSC